MYHSMCIRGGTAARGRRGSCSLKEEGNCKLSKEGERIPIPSHSVSQKSTAKLMYFYHLCQKKFFSESLVSVRTLSESPHLNVIIHMMVCWNLVRSTSGLSEHCQNHQWSVKTRVLSEHCQNPSHLSKPVVCQNIVRIPKWSVRINLMVCWNIVRIPSGLSEHCQNPLWSVRTPMNVVNPYSCSPPLAGMHIDCCINVSITVVLSS